MGGANKIVFLSNRRPHTQYDAGRWRQSGSAACQASRCYPASRLDWFTYVFVIQIGRREPRHIAIPILGISAFGRSTIHDLRKRFQRHDRHPSTPPRNPCRPDRACSSSFPHLLEAASLRMQTAKRTVQLLSTPPAGNIRQLVNFARLRPRTRKGSPAPDGQGSPEKDHRNRQAGGAGPGPWPDQSMPAPPAKLPGILPAVSTGVTSPPEKHRPHPGGTAVPPADVPCQIHCEG